MQRPDFDSISNFAEFSKYYWYRDELIQICRAKGLKHDGGKIELYHVIESYFAGEKILPEQKSRIRHKRPLRNLHLIRDLSSVDLHSETGSESSLLSRPARRISGLMLTW